MRTVKKTYRTAEDQEFYERQIIAAIAAVFAAVAIIVITLF
jgi:hypothetical protein